jgi:hypothetical protein
MSCAEPELVLIMDVVRMSLSNCDVYRQQVPTLFLNTRRSIALEPLQRETANPLVALTQHDIHCNHLCIPQAQHDACTLQDHV